LSGEIAVHLGASCAAAGVCEHRREPGGPRQGGNGFGSLCRNKKDRGCRDETRQNKGGVLEGGIEMKYRKELDQERGFEPARVYPRL
jgi:hypothetical protein